jgi:hypothetical protein
MSKRLGIFGDSFSDPSWNTNEYPSWVELLGNDYTVTNFSKCASSLWYSYQQLKTHYLEFDTCIFVATVYGRFYLENLDKHLNVNVNTWPIKNNVNLGKIYYDEFFSLEREKTFHKFMINDILSMPNVMFIPAFEECIVNSDCISLNHFANAELHHYGIVNYQGPDDRKCHLTKENTQVVYSKILNALNANSSTISLSMNDFKPPVDPFNFYFNRDIV